MSVTNFLQYSAFLAMPITSLDCGLRRLSDLVGADIGLHVGKNFMNEWPERNYKAFIFPLLNEAGMLGEKTGKGFYAFDKKCDQPPPCAGPACSHSRHTSAGVEQVVTYLHGLGSCSSSCGAVSKGQTSGGTWDRSARLS